MSNRIDDMECCETCNHCNSIHIIMNGEYCRGMLHYCKLRKKIVDKDDKCRKWQKSELLCKFEQEAMSTNNSAFCILNSELD
ncbi:MAG: hypothetical protein K2J01_06405 [Clostridiales bacterium]|nr:hypothetical protein [Clostridiales bacterium]